MGSPIAPCYANVCSCYHGKNHLQKINAFVLQKIHKWYSLNIHHMYYCFHHTLMTNIMTLSLPV